MDEAASRSSAEADDCSFQLIKKRSDSRRAECFVTNVVSVAAGQSNADAR